MAASSAAQAEVPAEPAAPHLQEQQQQPCPGQSQGVTIIRVKRSSDQENWCTYSNTAY